MITGITRLLEFAFDRARTLTDAEQDRLAHVLNEELDAARGCDEPFAATGDGLAKLAREALERDSQRHQHSHILTQQR